ncbi:hypothetical protein K0U07_00015, partial [bacterium]|nr:hypothetical protein [bacterium]
YTAKNDVRKYAYRRAAELALSRGYQYFMIIDQEDQTTTKKYLKTHENESVTADYLQEVLVKDSRPYVPDYTDHIYHPHKKEKNTTTFVDKSVYPAIRLNIKCFKARPEGFDVVDAQYFLLSNT